MATSVGDLVINLSANKRGLDQGLQQARSSVVKFARETERKQKGLVGNLGTAATGGLARLAGRAPGGLGRAAMAAGPAGLAIGATVGLAAGLGKFVSAEAAAANAINDFAKRIAIPVEKLSQLRYAADVTGVGASALESSLQGMTRRISEAAGGSGDAVKALAELGLSAKKLEESSPDQQLNVIADALATVGNSSDRVRIAAKLFGDEGVRMLQMLDGGAAGLAKLASEADAMGVTLTESAAAKAAELAKANVELGAAFDGLKKEIAEGLTPAVTDAVKFLAERVKELRGGSEEDGSGPNVVTQQGQSKFDMFQPGAAANANAAAAAAGMSPAAAALAKGRAVADAARGPVTMDLPELDKVAIQQARDSRRQIAAINEQVLDPIERAKRDIEHARQLLNSGLSQEAFDKYEEMINARMTQELASMPDPFENLFPDESDTADRVQTALRGGAAKKDSSEFYSRIFAAMDNGSGNPAQQTAKGVTKMVSDLARMREGIDEMRRGKVKMVTIEEAAG